MLHCNTTFSGSWRASFCPIFLTVTTPFRSTAAGCCRGARLSRALSAVGARDRNETRTRVSRTSGLTVRRNDTATGGFAVWYRARGSHDPQASPTYMAASCATN
jgi:hypothetical protein